MFKKLVDWGRSALLTLLVLPLYLVIKVGLALKLIAPDE